MERNTLGFRSVLRRAATLIVLISVAWAPGAWATQEMGRLLSVLVDKGLLTRSEAQTVLGELVTVDLADKAEPEPATRREPPEDTLLSGLRMSGDLRVRYQDVEFSNLPQGADAADKERAARYRWRFGMDLPIDDRWSVGFGLTSGGSDPRSTNQTYRDAFQSYDARIDYAYARYAWNERFGVAAGKFKNPLWTAKDLLWDSDIRPEGIAATYTAAAGADLEIGVNAGFLVLSDEEKGSREDAYMWQLQAHARWQATPALRFDFAPTLYWSDDLSGTPGLVANASPSNSRDLEGNLLYDYDAVAASASLVWAPADHSYAAELYGEYVHAMDPDNDNNGWLVGLQVGAARLERLGQWQVEYSYRRLEQDAWPEFLTDSDFLAGITSVKGGELEARFALGQRTSIGIDYYFKNEVLDADTDGDLLQVDLVVTW